MELLHPDIFIQEIKGVPPMEGIATSTAGFVGITTKGPLGAAELCTSWAEFVRKWGGLTKDSLMPYAVKGFFENGGQRCYISRVVHFTTGAKTSVKASKVLSDGSAAQTLKIEARTDGAWGNDISITVANSVGSKFDLTVDYGADQYKYEQVAVDTADQYFANNDLISATVLATGKTLANVAKTALTAGADGIVGIVDTDYVGDASTKNGLYSFDGIPVNIIAVPGITTSAVQLGMITYVEGRKDCFAILDPALGNTPTQMVTQKSTMASEYAALYYPNVKVADAIGVGSNPYKVVPPSGHVIGCMSRVDATRGVWKAPAGIDAKVNGIIGLEYGVNTGEHDILNPAGINVIKAVDDNGICIWGTRTLAKGEYKYIPVRRTIIYLATTLRKNMPWAVFEPNDERLWGKIRTSVESFLTTMWKDGGLKGATAAEAFYVKCDGDLNTKDVIDQGRTYVDIAVAPQKPAEFVVFRLSLR